MNGMSELGEIEVVGGLDKNFGKRGRKGFEGGNPGFGKGGLRGGRRRNQRSAGSRLGDTVVSGGARVKR